MSTSTFETIYNSDPNFQTINSDLSNRFDNFAEELWDHMFEQYYNHAYTVVRHKDVSQYVDENYYIRVFREQLEGGATVIKALTDLGLDENGINGAFIAPSDEQAAAIDAAMKEAHLSANDSAKFSNRGAEVLDGITSEQKDILSNLTIWDSYLQYDINFKRKSTNILVYIFEILKASLIIYEDMIEHKAKKIELQNVVAEINSSILADVDTAEISDTNIKNKVSPYSGKSTFEIPTNADDTETQLHNNEAGAFRDVIRGYRSLSQKRVSAISLEGSAASSAMTQQSELLKAFVTFQGQLIKQVISRA